MISCTPSDHFQWYTQKCGCKGTAFFSHSQNFGEKTYFFRPTRRNFFQKRNYLLCRQIATPQLKHRYYPAKA